ncbi:MAG TPA: GNAT family N-acetyltransferase [Streptosporangiaceae bacterium]
MGEQSVMSLSTLTARSRALWESLAGAPVSFGPALRVVVSPQSRLCPPGWAGLVVIGDAAIATAPTSPVAELLEPALGMLAPRSLTDAGVLGSVFPGAQVLGPASLAYLDAGEFRPRDGPGVTEAVPPQDPAVRRFLSAADLDDANESGLDEITSPAFAIREHGRIVAAAGYRDWPGRVAHLSVLTAVRARGRGLGTATASAAVAAAIGEGKLPQWRARPDSSRRIARSLGFRELGCQVSLRLLPGRL